MRYFLTGILLFFFVFNAAAQQVQTIEQYCMVKVFWNAFAGEASIAVDDGTKADALNYMGKQGWKMMHVVSSNTDNTEYMYLFKREVKREEND